MTTPRFLQIHTLASYPATLLNRDDSGLAKRLPFGDATRTRISSQCLKRRWRKPAVRDEDVKCMPWALQTIGAPMAVRSREIPERRIAPALANSGAGTDETRAAAVEAMARLLYTPKKKDAQPVKDRQALLIGDPEIAYINKRLVEILQQADSPTRVAKAVDECFKRKELNNLNAMLEGRRGAIEAGLEAALFGRMVTSDPDANTDAAIHVAHAFTVHAEATESDYFTVVDDLKQEAAESGAGGLFDTELTAGLFYGYVVIDLPLLTSNLGGDKALAAKVIEHLVHLIATVSPGAKKGSTAPYSYAEFMLIEAGVEQPRTLANAYRKPCKADTEAAKAALTGYLEKVDAAYGTTATRRHLSVEPVTVPASQPAALSALAQWAAHQAGTDAS